MATENKALVKEVTATLLTEIKAAAGKVDQHPDHLKTLAEAFALVAEHDPKAPGRVGGIG